MNENLKNQLVEYGADVETALKRFMGKDALYMKFLVKFLDDKNFSGLEENLTAKDYDEAYKSAHALKGVTGNLGLLPLFDIAAKLSEMLRKNDGTVDEATVSQMAEDLAGKYAKFCKIMKDNM